MSNIIKDKSSIVKAALTEQSSRETIGVENHSIEAPVMQKVQKTYHTTQSEKMVNNNVKEKKKS